MHLEEMMKKLMTITLALCAVIVALACGSNDPEIDGTASANPLAVGKVFTFETTINI